MTDESNAEILSKEIEEEVLKKVDQLCKDVFHRMIYGPSQEEEQTIKDIWLKKPYTLSHSVKDSYDIGKQKI